jgi:hypothetical protein
MNTIAYGEDGLTLWALTCRLQKVLDKLEDRSDRSRCIVVYRPSFGRSGGSESAQFGEFDAILITPLAVYLIESKWDNVSNARKDRVVLDDVQITRHRIFAWLRRKWQERSPRNSDDFRNQVQGEFTSTFPNRPLARSDRLLARNLVYLLQRLKDHPGEIINVLLYFHRDRVEAPQFIVNAQGIDLTRPSAGLTFRPPICLTYQGLDKSGLFELQP